MTAAAEALLTSNPAPLAPVGASFTGRLVSGLAALRALAPYAAIELLLPGGSLIALVLWLYRRYKKATPHAA